MRLYVPTARVKPRIYLPLSISTRPWTVRIENPLEMSWRKGRSETISCIMRLVSSSIFFTWLVRTCSTTRTISRPKGVEAISDTDESMVNGAMGVRAGKRTASCAQLASSNRGRRDASTPPRAPETIGEEGGTVGGHGKRRGIGCGQRSSSLGYHGLRNQPKARSRPGPRATSDARRPNIAAPSRQTQASREHSPGARRTLANAARRRGS